MSRISRRHLFLAAVGILAVAGAACANCTNRTLLMIDDADVLYTAGTNRVLHPLTRYTPGVAVIKPDRPWEGLLGYSSVHRIGDVYHMWYQTYDGTGSTFVALATSADGLAWTKPNLGVVEWRGSTANNLVWTATGHYGANVLYEPDDPDTTHRFKMASWEYHPALGVDRAYGLYVAFSPDGVRWSAHNVSQGPRLTGLYGGSPVTQPPYADQDADARMVGQQWLPALAMSDVIDVFRHPVTKQYLAYHKTWIDGIDGGQVWKRAVAVSTSTDFVTWSPKRHLVAWPDEHDDPSSAYLPGVGNVGTELHGGPTHYHAEAGVYLMLLQVLDWRASPSGALAGELALSRAPGGTSRFDRPFRASLAQPKFLPLSADPTAFDHGAMWTNGWPVDARDGSGTVRLYYGAYNSWGASPAPSFANRTGIGMAYMRRDRYASVGAVNASYGAQLTTRPVSLAGVCAITANVDSGGGGGGSAGGAVRVELLDEVGYRMRGFERDSAVPLNGTDAVDAPVRWQGGNSTVCALARREAAATASSSSPGTALYSLRVHFTGAARLFALRLVACSCDGV